MTQNQPCWDLGILGNPGATSRDDSIFSGERHFWPWALFLTKRVPEVVETRPADWPEINPVAFLHQVVLFIDRLI